MQRVFKSGLVMSLAMGVSVSIALAGPLNPPAGPVQPTTTGADEIDPRTEINSLPFIITTAGSYYLTQDLTGTGPNGVTVLVSDVFIDLNGFTLRGPGALPGGGNGVSVIGALENIVVQRGTIELWGVDGINASLASSGVIDQITSSDNGDDGIDVGDSWTISNCTVRCNAGRGIGGGNGGIIEGSLAEGNGAEGFDLGSGWIVEDSIADANIACGFMMGPGAAVSNSTAIANTGYGFSLGIDGSIVGSLSRGNDVGIGLGANAVARQCTTEGGLTGFEALGLAGAQIVECVSRGNAETGILAIASVVRGCYVQNVTGNAIAVLGESTVEQCTARNSNIGIFVDGQRSTVSQCSMILNATSLRVIGTDNLITSNEASQDVGIVYDIGTDNAFGAVINVGGGGQFQNGSSFDNLVF